MLVTQNSNWHDNNIDTSSFSHNFKRAKELTKIKKKNPHSPLKVQDWSFYNHFIVNKATNDCVVITDGNMDSQINNGQQMAWKCQKALNV